MHAVGRMGLCAPQWARGTGLHAVGRMGLGAPLLGVGLRGRGGGSSFCGDQRGICWLGRRSRRLGAPTVGVGITTIFGGQFPVLCPSRRSIVDLLHLVSQRSSMGRGSRGHRALLRCLRNAASRGQVGRVGLDLVARRSEVGRVGLVVSRGDTHAATPRMCALRTESGWCACRRARAASHVGNCSRPERLIPMSICMLRCVRLNLTD